MIEIGALGIIRWTNLFDISIFFSSKLYVRKEAAAAT